MLGTLYLSLNSLGLLIHLSVYPKYGDLEITFTDLTSKIVLHLSPLYSVSSDEENKILCILIIIDLNA